jgi:ribosomal protein S18 acetylase RimI-like enzyme
VVRSPTSTDLLEAHRAYSGFAGQTKRILGAQVLTNPRYPHLPRANCTLVGALEPPTDWRTIRDASFDIFPRTRDAPDRVMLFGEEVSDRLGGALLLDGFRPSLIRLLEFGRDILVPELAPGRVVWVDTFRMPARYSLRYRIAQERAGAGAEAAEAARLYLSRADARWRRTAGAYVDGTLAAAADLCPIGSVTEITYVETAPEFRGRGLAREVVSFLVRAGFEEGARAVYLAAQDGPLSTGFYGKLGFEPAATITMFQRPVAFGQS